MINKIDKSLAKLAKERERGTKFNKIRDERGNVTTNLKYPKDSKDMS